MPEQNPTLQERMKEITGQIEQGILDVFDSEKYKHYLSVMARFHEYSYRNVMLIYLQKPEATLVAGYNKWRDSFGRQVNRGEKGIRIIAPVKGKRKMMEEKRNPITAEVMKDTGGNPLTEVHEQEATFFRAVTVFDVSQTSGRPLPQLAGDLAGNVEQYREFLEALRRSSPVPIKFESLNGEDGMFRLKEQDILIQPGMSEVQTVDAIIHEIAHARLHAKPRKPIKGEDGKLLPPKTRQTEEVEAESIAYSVCQYYGIQTGENSFPYIASWSKDKTLPELKASLDAVRKTANDLIVDIDRCFRAVCRERGIQPKIADKNPVVTKRQCGPQTDAAQGAAPSIEKAFYEGQADAYLLYQAKPEVPYKFEPCDFARQHDHPIQLADYSAVYTGPLPDGASLPHILEDLFYRFNMDRPADFTGHSMSVSDIIAIRKDGVVSCHYVDSAGFRSLPDIPPPENYLKNAEVSTEDDYGMIDGVLNNGSKSPEAERLEQQAMSGQPISLYELSQALQAEKKPSVVDRLKRRPAHKPRTNKPQKHEQEL